MSRVRISHFVVQPVLLVDDGVDLMPGPTVQPIVASVKDLATVCERVVAEVAAMPVPGADDPR